MSDELLVEITTRRIDVGQLEARVGHPGAGARLVFVGTVRDSKHGRAVLGIDYEAYTPMAEKVLARIGRDILSRWPVLRLALVHRIGALAVGDASIAILLACPHRAEGFEALRYGIEAVKRDLPVWKKERFEDGEVWVQEGS
jgi:molybdopterin synthase catalytic subunit